MKLVSYVYLILRTINYHSRLVVCKEEEENIVSLKHTYSVLSIYGLKRCLHFCENRAQFGSKLKHSFIETLNSGIFLNPQD
jgi:hypothetical protein